MNNPAAMITERTTVRFIMIFSFFSRFFASASVRSSPSSSSKKLAEKVSVFIPRTRESTKLKMPLIKGIFRGVFHGMILLYCRISTSISPSGFLTATEYLPPFRIMIPSSTACPPIFDDFIYFLLTEKIPWIFLSYA